MLITALSLFAAGCDPGFLVEVANASDRTYYAGSASEGVFRVDPRTFGLGPSGLSERSEPMWLYDDRCNVVLTLGRLAPASYLVSIAADGTANVVVADASAAHAAPSPLRDVGNFERSDKCG